MHPDLLDDKGRPWPLNVPQPDPAQLMDWFYRRDADLARTSPEAALAQVLADYMRAGKVSAKWGKFTMEFAQAETKRLSLLLVASVKHKDDTMRPWLEKNARRDRDKFQKNPRALLEAIQYLTEVGVATEKRDGPNGVEWTVERLQCGPSQGIQTGEAGQRDNRELVCCLLSEENARKFVVLRETYHNKSALQNEWRDATLQNKSIKIAAKVHGTAVRKKRASTKKTPFAVKK